MKLTQKDLVALVGPERAAAMLDEAKIVAAPEAMASGMMRLPKRRIMSKPEEAYHRVLQAEFRAANGYRLEYETLTLRLASGTLYTPDFTVWHGTALVRCIEVKGQIKLRSLDRATTKFKEAITSFPHITFRHAFQDKLTGWGVQERCHNDPPKKK